MEWNGMKATRPLLHPAVTPPGRYSTRPLLHPAVTPPGRYNTRGETNTTQGETNTIHLRRRASPSRRPHDDRANRADAPPDGRADARADTRADDRADAPPTLPTPRADDRSDTCPAARAMAARRPRRRHSQYPC